MQKWLFNFTILVLSSYALTAQVTPQPSPGASITQTIGITQVKIDYSRPGAKGRTIFGGLVPFGQVWRTGANAATKIEFTADVKIDGLQLPAGTYAILSFPGKNTWVVIFSRNLTVTEQGYSPQTDALRVEVKTSQHPFAETFTIDFSDLRDEKAKLNLYWENTAISLEISVNNEAIILAAIDAKNNEAAGAFQQAAEYLVNHNMNSDKALEYVDKSISLKETFRNVWIKAVLLNQTGHGAEALTLAYRAQELGATDPVYPLFREAVEKTILELKLSLPHIQK